MHSSHCTVVTTVIYHPILLALRATQYRDSTQFSVEFTLRFIAIQNESQTKYSSVIKVLFFPLPILYFPSCSVLHENGYIIDFCSCALHLILTAFKFSLINLMKMIPFALPRYQYFSSHLQYMIDVYTITKLNSLFPHLMSFTKKIMCIVLYSSLHLVLYGINVFTLPMSIILQTFILYTIFLTLKKLINASSVPSIIMLPTLE